MSALPELDEVTKYHFLLMFGHTPEELQAQGVEVTEEWFRANQAQGANRAYDYQVARFAAGQSALPFWAPNAWTSHQMTMLGPWRVREVMIDRDAVRIADEDEGLDVSAPPSQVVVRSVPMWFGLGLRLEIPRQDPWYVQPRFGTKMKAFGQNRTIVPVFKAALREAGAQWK